jgi:hypothetical protein
MQKIRISAEYLSCAALLVALLVTGSAAAQEMVPRAYWPAPVDTNIVVLAYQRNSGDVVIDPSLPITGVESDID